MAAHELEQDHRALTGKLLALGETVDVPRSEHLSFGSMPNSNFDCPTADVAPQSQISSAWLYGIWAAFTAGLLVYSQTFAFTADEGFHLLAAQLIKGGMRPYLDFCFPQTPLNAYWNAFWMRVLGEGWRPVHAVAALETAAAVILASQFVLSHLPERAWRVAGAIAATVMIGCSMNVTDFGTLGQAYGICLFTTVAAFRLSVVAVAAPGIWQAAAAGTLAGAGAASSLLAAPVAPVLLLWIWWNNRTRNRWIKALAYAAGAAIPFLPVLWLFVQSPRVVWFNIAQYHLHYRAVYWPHQLGHDLNSLTGWLDDAQSLLLGMLALFGVVYIRTRSAWTSRHRAEFRLCVWLVLGLTVELACAHPTFSRYFCLLVPFLGILAVPGLYALGSRVLDPGRPFWPVLIVSLLTVGSLARDICLYLSSDTWPKYEVIARKLLAVTPPGKEMFTEESLYFLTRHKPPRGLEFQYSHKLQLPTAQRAALHIVTEDEIKQQIASGTFWSAATCDDDFVDDYGLDESFQHKEQVRECPVYWGGRPPHTPSQ